MKRAFIIHGWEGTPDQHWLPWLKAELEKKDFAVQVPAMPNTDEPEMNAWISTLTKLVGTPDKETYLIGHSIGCQTILHYLQNIDTKIGGAVLVAPWFTLTEEAMPDDESKEIAKPWIESSFDYAKIKSNSKIIAIFSTDDPAVPMENVEMFQKRLDAKTIVKENRGHFTSEDDINELPSALNAIMELQ